MRRWSGEGEHILAQYGAGSVLVYPAYRPASGHLAAELGVRGQALRRLNDERLLDVEDVSAFVAGQRRHLNTPDLNTPDRLWTPTETVFPAPDLVTPG